MQLLLLWLLQMSFAVTSPWLWSLCQRLAIFDCKVLISLMMIFFAQVVFIIQHPGHDPREREDEDEKKKQEQEAKLKKLLKENEELQKDIAEVIRHKIFCSRRCLLCVCNNLFCAERQKNRLAEKTHRHEERAGRA